MAGPTYAFVSYAHSDFIIADEIRKQLTILAQYGSGGNSLTCFLDTENIDPGKKFEQIIRQSLEQTDWLLVVYTGDQSVYCGFEIGLYSFMKHDDMPEEEKPVVWLHDVDRTKLPGVADGYNTTSISRVAPYLADDTAASAPEVTLWWNSPVGRFLRKICQDKGMYTPNHRTNDPPQYKLDIAKSASRIAHAFEEARKEDEVSETPVQAVMELTVFPPFEGESRRLTETSILVGSSRAFETLGINAPLSLDTNQVQAPQITWGQLRETLARPERANIPWVDKLETNIRRAIALKTQEPNDVTFKGKDGHIYRAILTRHKLYKNGKRRFFILLVETFDRKFVGDRETSMLLTALTLASRWRFTFFEKWHETLRQFDAHRSDREFHDACKQFEYNMEWMENEGTELGADDPELMIDAFGHDNRARVERFYSEFYEAKKKMKSHFPQTFDGISPGKRAEVQTAIASFLTEIKQQNADFLKLCVQKYAERIHAD